MIKTKFQEFQTKYGDPIEKLFVLLFILFGALIVLYKVNPFSIFPGHDGGYYLYAGNEILNGKLPYIDFWDHKPPVIFYINALGIFLGKGTQWGVFLIQFVFLFGSIYCWFEVIKKKWGIIAGLISTTFGLLMLNKVLGEGNYTEQYSLLFNALAVYIYFRFSGTKHARLSLFAIGFLGGLSFMTRPNNIGGILAILFSTGIESLFYKNWKQFISKVFSSLSGFLISVLLISLYFIINGIWFDMFEATILYNFIYSNKSGFEISGIFSFFMRYPKFGLLLCVVFLISIYQFIKSIFKNDFDFFSFFAINLILFELFMSNLSGKQFPHYYIVFFHVVFYCSGYLMYFLSPKSIRDMKPLISRKEFAKSFLGIYFLIFILFSDIFFGYVEVGNNLLFKRENGVQIYNEIAHFIRSNTESREKVLFWGGKLGLHYLSDTTAISKYAWYPFYVDSDISREFYPQYFQDLVNEQPKFIVDLHIHSPDQTVSLNPTIRIEQLMKSNNDYYLPSNIDDVLGYIEVNYEFIIQIDGSDIYQRVE